jgi:hypothetical protein
LLLDALFEFLVGAMLIVFRSDFADGFELASGSVLVAGVVFLAAGVLLLGVLLRPSDEVVRMVAVLNLAAGLGLWLVLAARWGDFDAEVRWFTTAVANMFVALAALEWLGLRRS